MHIFFTMITVLTFESIRYIYDIRWNFLNTVFDLPKLVGICGKRVIMNGLFENHRQNA